MSAGRNKAIVRRYLAWLWGRGEAAALELIAADYIDHHPPPGITADRAGLLEAVRIFGAAFADLELSVEAVIAEGDLVADRWSLRARHQGDFFGIAPTGQWITLTGLDMHRIVGGKIVETWHQEDILGLLRQLRSDPPRRPGAEPAPAGPQERSILGAVPPSGGGGSSSPRSFR